jgi:hypothetical protein
MPSIKFIVRNVVHPETLVQALEALRADVGYMLNAVIGLESGGTKQSAIRCLNDRISQVRAILAQAKERGL